MHEDIRYSCNITIFVMFQLWFYGKQIRKELRFGAVDIDLI